MKTFPLHRQVLCVLACWLCVSNVFANDLKGHASPYLALHGNDPVEWQEWGKPALDQARREDKLVFVSIGYFSCHWCHVMQRESFSDKGVAAVLNKHFVSIKVDRELNPVLDQRLMEFVQATAGRGGWPLNVFLTPDGHPLAGIVYRPKEQFFNLLGALNEHWGKEREELAAAAAEVDQLLSQANADEQKLVEKRAVGDMASEFRRDAMLAADTLQGGFSGQTRFPSIPQLQALVDLNRLEPVDEELEFLRLTLDQMISKGLRDHVGGGFFRYTVDPGWETPHYEKMLYTNAMMVPLLLDASQLFGQQSYRDAAISTLAFMQREMNGSEGTFIASLSAVDDQNREGGYYLWDQQELKKYLSAEDVDLLNVAWGMNRTDSGEGVLPLLQVDERELADSFSLSSAQVRKRIESIQNRLTGARDASRVLPRDVKRLAGWNGLSLAALARGLEYDPKLRVAGDRLAQFLMRRIWVDGSVVKAVDQNGRSLGNGSFEDYAYVAYGLAKWGEATKNHQVQKKSQEISKAAVARFLSNKGWKSSEDSLLPGTQYQRHLPEYTLLSPEALLLSIRTSEKQALLSQVNQGMADNPYGYPSLISLATRARLAK